MSDGTGLIKRFYTEVVEGGNLALIDELSTNDFVDHEEGLPGQPPGKEGVRFFLNAIRSAFPDSKAKTIEPYPRIHLRPITHGGMTAVLLTRRPGGLQAFKMVLTGEARGAEPDPRVHEGYEWLYVLNGRLRLVLGDKDFELRPGEAAEFDTHTPHWFASADGRPVEFLSLFGQQGERMHVRARPKPS